MMRSDAIDSSSLAVQRFVTEPLAVDRLDQPLTARLWIK